MYVCLNKPVLDYGDLRTKARVRQQHEDLLQNINYIVGTYKTPKASPYKPPPNI